MFIIFVYHILFQKPYAVFDFSKERPRSLLSVPVTWIDDDLCYWPPPYSTDERYARILQIKSIIKHLRLIYSYDKFNEIMQTYLSIHVDIIHARGAPDTEFWSPAGLDFFDRLCFRLPGAYNRLTRWLPAELHVVAFNHNTVGSFVGYIIVTTSLPRWPSET